MSKDNVNSNINLIGGITNPIGYNAMNQQQALDALVAQQKLTSMPNQTSVLNNSFADGGDMDTYSSNGTTWNAGLKYINAGGTHEENPNDGIQVGVDPNGVPNKVEEGEVIYDNMVFTNRIQIPKEIREKLKLKNLIGKTFSEGAKYLAKDLEENYNDPIYVYGVESMLKKLFELQEEYKIQQDQNELNELLQSLTPEEQEELMMQQQYAQQQQAQQLSPEEQVNQEMIFGPSGEESQMQRTGEMQQAFARGGNLFSGEGVSFEKRAEKARPFLHLKHYIYEDFVDPLNGKIYNSKKIRDSIYEKYNTIRDRDKLLEEVQQEYPFITREAIDDALDAFYFDQDVIRDDISKYAEKRQKEYVNQITKDAKNLTTKDLLFQYPTLDIKALNILTDGKVDSFLKENGITYMSAPYITFESLINRNYNFGSKSKSVAANDLKKDFFNQKKQESKSVQKEEASESPVTDNNSGDGSDNTTKPTSNNTTSNNTTSNNTTSNNTTSNNTTSNTTTSNTTNNKSSSSTTNTTTTNNKKQTKRLAASEFAAWDNIARRNPEFLNQIRKEISQGAVDANMSLPKYFQSIVDPLNTGEFTNPTDGDFGKEYLYDDRYKDELTDLIANAYNKNHYYRNNFGNVFGNTTVNSDVAIQDPQYDTDRWLEDLDNFNPMGEGSTDGYYNYSDQIKIGDQLMSIADYEKSDRYINQNEWLIDQARKGNATAREILNKIYQKGSKYSPNGSLNISAFDENGKLKDTLTNEDVQALKDQLFFDGKGSVAHTPAYMIQNTGNTRRWAVSDDNELIDLTNASLDGWEEDTTARRLYGDNGDEHIFYKRKSTVTNPPTTEEENPGTSTNIPPVEKLPTWMRYAPILGSAAGLTMAMQQPDYSNQITLNPTTIGFKPVGNYLTYNPLDTQFQINQMNAQTAGTRNAIMNNAGTRGAATNALLANNYNAQNAIGQAYMTAAQYNDQQRKQVEDFNRATNMFNSEGAFKAAGANQAAINAAREKQAVYNSQLRQQIDDDRADSIMKNLGQLSNNIGKIGNENMEFNWRNGLIKSGYYGNIGDNYDYFDNDWFYSNTPLEREARLTAREAYQKKKQEQKAKKQE